MDHPTNLGTLCPKGAALKDFIHAPTRLKQPMVRRAGSDRFEPVSWDQALDRIARLMKDDRDANFLGQNEAGLPVNRWTTVGVSANVIDDSYNALHDSITYRLFRASGTGTPQISADNRSDTR